MEGWNSFIVMTYFYYRDIAYFVIAATVSSFKCVSLLTLPIAGRTRDAYTIFLT